MAEKLTDEKNAKKNMDKFGSQLDDFSKTDFDGHTEFKSLSYEEKLLWLSRAVQFSSKYSNAEISAKPEKL